MNRRQLEKAHKSLFQEENVLYMLSSSTGYANKVAVSLLPFTSGIYYIVIYFRPIFDIFY